MMWGLNIVRSKRTRALDGKSIEEDAHKIRIACDETVQAIKKRLNTISDDQPLIVLAGEDHSVVSHVIHHMCVMEELRREGTAVAAAIEYPSNFVEVIFIEQVSRDRTITEAEREQFSAYLKKELEANPTSHPLLYSAAFLSPSPYAPHSNATLTNYLKKHNIPIAFVDAAIDDEGYLKQDDPATRDAILKAERSMGCKAGEHIAFSIEDSLGMAARNIHMAKATQDFAAQLGQVRVIFVITGNAHVLGYKGDSS